MDSPFLSDVSDGNVTDAATGTSRRTFLTRTATGAAAGGVLWVAPSVLTMDAAAAASCGTGTHTLSWTDAALPTGTLPNSGTRVPTGSTVTTPAMGGVTATIDWTDTSGVSTDGGTGSLGSSFSIINQQIGGNTGKSWYMQMHATQTTQALTTKFTFKKSAALIGLVGFAFTMYDIDRVTGANTLWTDHIVVTGTRNGVAVPLTLTKPGVGANSPVINPVSPATANVGDAVGGGDLNISPTVGDGNVTFTFTGAVDTVLITYNNPEANHLPSTPFQFTGIGNLTWTTCV